jgi:hypothetical protein
MHFRFGSYSVPVGGANRVIFAAAMLALTASPMYAATTPKTTVHQASAYGAEVNVGSVVKLGKVALAELPSCYTQTTGSFSDSVTSVNKSGIISTGVVNSVAFSDATSSTGSSDVVGINILNGLISGSEIKAVSSSAVTGTKTFTYNATGSTLGDLKVLGIAVGANVAPNTVIDLPLVGSVTLNEQTVYTSADEAELTVNMIHVRITLGSNKGTEVIIGNAFSQIKTQNAPGVVGGYAYGPRLQASPVSVGPLVEQIIPCYGTGGAVESDSIVSGNLPGLLTTGTVSVTGEGNVTSVGTSSQATTSVAGVNLLGGLVSVSALTGTATASTTDGVSNDYSGGTTFVGISVAGHPEITANVAENTKLNIANLGILYLNRVQTGTDYVRVTPIELIIETTNTLGLPIGAVLTVGNAEADLHSAAVP